MAQSYDLSRLVQGESRATLRVQDDSLLDIQIRQGDLLVVSWQTEAHSGQLAIVNLTGSEESVVQVLRYVNRVEGQIHLQATNRALPTTTVDRVEIVGVVAGVIRVLE